MEKIQLTGKRLKVVGKYYGHTGSGHGSYGLAACHNCHSMALIGEEDWSEICDGIGFLGFLDLNVECCCKPKYFYSNVRFIKFVDE